MFKLTEHGEDTAQNVSAKLNRTESDIIHFMYMMCKPVELEEVQDEMRISDEKTLTVLKRLVNGGYVEEV